MTEEAKILIVENSEEFTEWMETELGKINSVNIVGKTDTIQMGQILLSQTNPNILILDLVLSDGSGLKLLKSIRERKLPLTVIVFTNYSFYRKECKIIGSDYFYDKSNEFEQMISTVKELSENIDRESKRNEAQ